MASMELIGANDGQTHYTAQTIAAVLAGGRIRLATGSEFIGRPQTRVFSDGADVVKIRAELDLPFDKARQWACAALRQERQLGAHHPHKTWFVLARPDQGTVLVGNACPHLTPLHMLFKTAPDGAAARGRYLAILDTVFGKYLLLAKNTGAKLDEGLANFGVDGGGQVHYLDDEHYRWDNFVAFSVMLGVFIRGYDWLDQAFMAALAHGIARQVDSVFEDSHCRAIIDGQLQSLFMPSPHKEQLLATLRAGLRRPQAASSARPAAKRPAKPNRPSQPGLYAVMADIHANDAALEAVLAFYRQHNIRQGIVLGDVVGYGPAPGRCISLLQASPFAVIKGNHDHAVASGQTGRGFNGHAKTVIDWTVGQLSSEQRGWLDGLPACLHDDLWLAVHGAPVDPAFFYGYVYPLTAEENLDYLQQKNIRLCVHGHSHMPGVYFRDRANRDHFLNGDRISLDGHRHSLACPGAVGQPRNGDPRSQCAIYDSNNQQMLFFALPYDIDAVVGQLKQHGLPDTLGQRLSLGK